MGDLKLIGSGAVGGYFEVFLTDRGKAEALSPTCHPEVFVVPCVEHTAYTLSLYPPFTGDTLKCFPQLARLLWP